MKSLGKVMSVQQGGFEVGWNRDCEGNGPYSSKTQVSQTSPEGRLAPSTASVGHREIYSVSRSGLRTV